MTGSESVEQTKQQDGVKDDGKKPIETKEEDLVCYKKTKNSLRFYFIFSLKKINN